MAEASAVDGNSGFSSLPSAGDGARRAGFWRRPGIMGGLLGVLLVMLTAALYAAVVARAPRGRFFVGTLFFRDDFLQYLSFAEQASRGQWLFVNKFDPRALQPFLLNLEWLATGWLGAAFGNPARGAQAVGALAAIGFGAGVERLLRRCGLTGWALLWGTFTVMTGGGLGWALFLGGVSPARIPDLATLLYPSTQLLTASGHAMVGLALLSWSLVLWLKWRERRGTAWPWLVAATVMGLSRPFDLAVFVGVVVITTLIEARRGETPRTLSDLARLMWLVPVLGYDAIAFKLHPSFGLWGGEQNVVPTPPLAALAMALAPGIVLTMVPAARIEAQHVSARRAVRVWVGLVLAGLAFPVVAFGLQFATSAGAAVLLLAAATVPRRLLPAVALALLPTSLVLVWIVGHPPRAWFFPQDYQQAARYLVTECAPRDRVYGPSDPSLVIAALTPCDAVFGHRVLTWRQEQRAAESMMFYDPRTAPAWRARYLDAIGAKFVLLPADHRDWLGTQATFRKVLATRILEVWCRD
jgi:hypothetical protein